MNIIINNINFIKRIYKINTYDLNKDNQILNKHKVFLKLNIKKLNKINLITNGGKIEFI